jgi:hypothetical protein
MRATRTATSSKRPVRRTSISHADLNGVPADASLDYVCAVGIAFIRSPRTSCALPSRCATPDGRLRANVTSLASTVAYLLRHGCPMLSRRNAFEVAASPVRQD